MKADILVELNKEQPDVFTIYILSRLNDGFINAARKMLFTERFRAQRINDYLCNWEEWPWASPEKLETLRRIASKALTVEFPKP